jgi:rSAM/selenodomain-associated transferase 2
MNDRLEPRALRLSIVVPTLNEEVWVGHLLAGARAQADELIVTDGGSTDRTVEVARRLGARVVAGPPGRGGQLNRGAAAAGGDVLLFLHADTRLPAGAALAVLAAVAGGAVGGGFRVRFDDRRPLMRFGGFLATLRTRLTRLPLGDQAQFVTRETFERLGGYRDWPILEDLDFARRLKRAGRVAILAQPVTTAARRFNARGALATVARNWLIWLLFSLGAEPRRLARLYRDVR